jgi:cytochrome-b5 reductase
LKEELEKFVQDNNFGLKVFFIIDQAVENWNGGVGYINKDMISSNSPVASEDTLMLMCGPPVMCQKVVLPILIELGHKKEDIFEF